LDFSESLRNKKFNSGSELCTVLHELGDEERCSNILAGPLLSERAPLDTGRSRMTNPPLFRGGWRGNTNKGNWNAAPFKRNFRPRDDARDAGRDEDGEATASALTPIALAPCERKFAVFTDDI
jgi:hypothetical protein